MYTYIYIHTSVKKKRGKKKKNKKSGDLKERRGQALRPEDAICRLCPRGWLLKYLREICQKTLAANSASPRQKVTDLTFSGLMRRANPETTWNEARTPVSWGLGGREGRGGGGSPNKPLLSPLSLMSMHMWCCTNSTCTLVNNSLILTSRTPVAQCAASVVKCVCACACVYLMLTPH